MPQRAETPAHGADLDRLLALARAGDGDAFATLLDMHYDLIFRTAYKWSGNRSDAEDIAQEVCIKLAGSLSGFDGRSQFSSWLYRITLNAVRDGQRAQARRGRHLAALSQVSPEDAPPDQEDATAINELWAAVRRLPERQRDAVLLVYAEELPHAEAASILGCKEATVSWHIHEAKKALRGLL